MTFSEYVVSKDYDKVSYLVSVFIHTNLDKLLTEYNAYVQEQTTIQKVKYLLSELTDEQRFEILNEYCAVCGTQNSNCHCWNDI